MNKSVEDCLVIGVDFDARTNYGVVTVGRHQDGKLYIINVLENDEALDIYNKLIGIKNDSKKHGHWVLLDNCSNHGVYCSVCNKKVYKDWYGNVKVTSKYCPNCGAIMDEEFKRL